ncbi:MAG: GTPase KRas precursor [Candidatus Heimdallarchaeota archaeon LC_3]|nr:MAG: GTPase KRas precursor [Candidatus Heimdallarchaeota archaeon LC_3]
MYKIVLCGDGAVGKTSLRLKYMGRGFQAKYMMTIGADFSLKEILVADSSGITRTYKFQLWTLAGQQNFSSVRPLYFMDAHGAILVYDITRLSTFENINSWIKEIVKGIGKKTFALMIIANKIDLREQSDITISTEEGCEFVKQISDETFGGQISIPYIETSAKTGENVDKAFQKMAELINKTYP